MNDLLTKKYLFLSFLFIPHLLVAHIAQDLELDALFNTINYTKTRYGATALHTIVNNPIDDVSTLKNRQTIIKNMVQATDKTRQLTTALQTLHTYEQYLSPAHDTVSDIETTALSEFYFSSPCFKEWNYSPIGLELGQIAYCGNLLSSVAQHALAFALFTWGLEEEHTCAVHPAKKHKHHDHKHHHDHQPKHDHTHTKDHHDCNHSHSSGTTHAFKKLLMTPAFKHAFQLWHSIAQIQELYGIQAIIRNNVHCIKKIQAHLMHVAHGIHVIKHIHTILQDHPAVTTTLSNYQDLENIITHHNLSIKLQQLLMLLDSPTFCGKPSIFSRTGNILAAYKLAQECLDELQPALKVIGDIDAYVSCAHLFSKHKNSSMRYSFAQYNENTATPLLDAYNFWHPLLTTTHAQLNSLSLGGSNNLTRNILLTGPNACGKSTNLKAITVCAYLAQTITLVPAQHYIHTVYKEIYSSIIIEDNMKNNLSLFAVELTNAEKLIEKIEALKENEFMFVALDELFKSTHHEKGQKVAQALLKHLYTSPQVITIVSTHFEKLISLTDDQENCLRNYTVNNFILEPGVGHCDNSFEIINKKITSRLLI